MSSTLLTATPLQTEPTSLFFESHRLRLHYWDYGGEDKPALVLIHGGLDHARSWDWVAAALLDTYHVYAVDLRGHGDSEWAPGAIYTVGEHILDLTALCETIGTPLTLIGHSLGGVIALSYTGTFPGNVIKVVSIEGMGPPPTHHSQKDPYPDRMRRWIEQMRDVERRERRAYKDLESAVARMREANPHLSEEMARHLTQHGSNRMADGSYTWKFDPFVRGWPPYGFDSAQASELHKRIECPVLLFRGLESWASDPEKDGRAKALKDYRLVNVPNAGHWLHHDQLAVFLRETKVFLSETFTTR
ncbi:MAG TPA: alpha/beta hydrolase [Pyrinomonadaceae bacterium]